MKNVLIGLILLGLCGCAFNDKVLEPRDVPRETMFASATDEQEQLSDVKNVAMPILTIAAVPAAGFQAMGAEAVVVRVWLMVSVSKAEEPPQNKEDG